MIPRLDEIKARLAAASLGGGHESPLSDLAWLIAEREKWRCLYSDTFTGFSEENAKLRADVNRLTFELDDACEAIGLLISNTRLALIDDVESARNVQKAQEIYEATLARLGRG